MQDTYKILSLLLDYPTDELKANLPNIMPLVVEENHLSQAKQQSMQQFISYAQPLSLPEWQKHYVQLFDFTSHNSLYLFDQVYGDSRERGQAMVDLTEMYAKSGFKPSSNELPDYLPLFLEYLSLLSNKEEVEKLLGEVSHIIQHMKEALQKKEATYYHLLEVLL